MKTLAILLLICLVAAAAEEKKKTERPRRQAEITLRVIEAGSAEAMPNDAALLVPAELRKLLTFGRYHLLDSAYIRGREDEGLSLAPAGSLRGEVRFKVRSAVDPVELEYEVELRGAAGEKGSAPKFLETTALGKNGETIVLGASRMRESSKAMIVLLTGKLLP